MAAISHWQVPLLPLFWKHSCFLHNSSAHHVCGPLILLVLKTFYVWCPSFMFTAKSFKIKITLVMGDGWWWWVIENVVMGGGSNALAFMRIPYPGSDSLFPTHIKSSQIEHVFLRFYHHIFLDWENHIRESYQILIQMNIRIYLYQNTDTNE